MAGGVALNLLLEAARVSRDIDIFHDAEEAVHFSFATDRRLLEGAVTRSLRCARCPASWRR